ncbi:MAG: phosphopantetheinyl transferase [Acidobacteriaceae bacterium]|nr:phosphopantetheinyl transferase [Acidobacteriaceae bacterium]
MIAAPQKELVLNHEEVHIWSLSLSVPPICIDRLQQVLSEHECHRVSQFRFERDRNQFITCRGLLRYILSLYLYQDPGQLQLSSNAFGKPHLRTHNTTEQQDLRFNYSHADRLAVFAFARRREIGVDVELIRPDVARESIPEHFFCKAEVATLRALQLEIQGDAFFECWTRKEAYIKARGEGFRIPLNSFDVSSDHLVADQENSHWSLQSFVPAPGYVAALVTEGQGWRTRFIQSPRRFFTQQEGVPCCIY